MDFQDVTAQKGVRSRSASWTRISSRAVSISRSTKNKLAHGAVNRRKPLEQARGDVHATVLRNKLAWGYLSHTDVPLDFTGARGVEQGK
jgi:hypothetical protein